MLIAIDGPRATVLWWTLPTYMTLVGAALLASGGVLLWDTRRAWRAGHAVDSALLAAALGLIFARAAHVALNWPYFSAAPTEIFSLAAGGLDAHGAVLGAALGGFVASRVFKSSYPSWLGAAAFALPLIALAVWRGCAAVSCAYGAEVANLADYPSWLVWEAPGDFLAVAPRFAVQTMGMAAAALVLLVSMLAAWRGLRGRRRAGLALSGVMISSFALGFLRGDPAPLAAGLRVGQWLDLLLTVAALAFVVWPRRIAVPAP